VNLLDPFFDLARNKTQEGKRAPWSTIRASGTVSSFLTLQAVGKTCSKRRTDSKVLGEEEGGDALVAKFKSYSSMSVRPKRGAETRQWDEKIEMIFKFSAHACVIPSTGLGREGRETGGAGKKGSRWSIYVAGA